MLEYTVSLSKCAVHLDNVTFADSHQWRHSPGVNCDPESTIGILSQMLFQIKSNVINNPLDTLGCARSAKWRQTAAELQWYNKTRQNIKGVEEVACRYILQQIWSQLVPWWVDIYNERENMLFPGKNIPS